MASNPFDVAQPSAFEGVTDYDVTPNAKSGGSSLLTSQIAGTAALKDSTENSESGVLYDLQENIKTAQQTLDMGNEQLLRYQTAADRILKKNDALKSLKQTTSLISPELSRSVDTAVYNNLQADIEQKAKTALEEEAVDQIRTKIAAGDDTGARLLANRFREGKSSVLDVQRDQAVKQMIVKQAIDKAQLDNDNESWIHWFISGATNLIPTNFNFSLIGNVKEGTGGYDPSFFRFFTPGSELQKQAEAIGSMSATELSDKLPELIENFRSNSTTLGVTDPTKNLTLTKNILSGTTDNEALMNNLWGAVEVGSVVPFGWVKKVGTVPFTLASLGARKAAAETVRDAVEITLREGAAEATARTGIAAEDVIDNTLPSIINPEKASGPAPITPMSGTVNSSLEEAQRFLREWENQGINRFYTKEEFLTAVEATKNKVRERIGLEPEDWEVVTNQLNDGTKTFSVRATLPAHATKEEAVAFLQSRGLTHEGMISIEDVVNGEAKIIRPQDEGFTTMAYHGTDAEFDKFVDTFSAGNTKATDAKGAFYFTSEPRVAWTYAREAASNNAGGKELKEAKAAFSKAQDEFHSYIDKHGVDWDNPEYQKFEQAYAKAGEEVNRVTELSKGEGNIRPTLIDTSNFQIVDMDGMGYSPYTHGQILDEAKAEGKDGVMFVNYADEMSSYLPDEQGVPESSTVYAVFDTEKSIRSAFEMPKVVQDMSGAYFPHVEMNIPETGFWTSPLVAPSNGFVSRFWKNTSQLLDRRLFEKASASGNNRNRLQKLIQANLTKSFKQLPKNDRMWLEQVILKGTNISKWFSDTEFNTIFERATGHPPSERVIAAYKQYRVNNDLEYTLRNEDIYRSKVIRGFESARFSAMDSHFDMDVVADWSPSSVPTERVYNLSDDLHYTSQAPLTQSRLDDLRGQGYVMFKTEQPVRLKDGTTVDRFLAKREDVQMSPLRQEQLAYSPGGHRLYTHKYFVKQGQSGIQPDTGKEFLLNPNVFITAPTIREATIWARTMEQARNLVIDEGWTAEQLDEHIFKSQKNFPKGEEFIQKMEDGFISKDHPFEAVFDRESPSLYNAANEDISRFLDPEEVGFNGYYRTNGRMYYSAKGEHLKDYTGDLAPTLDPFEAQAKALYNVANLSTFSDFKTTAIDRWVRTYRNNLNIKGLPEEVGDSPATIFNSATVTRGTPIALQQQMEAQRDAIKRILGFESDFERGYRNWMRSTAEWIVSGSDSKLTGKLSEGVFWLQDKNPISFLRGLAFDMKLGMFNVGQMMIQTSTMFSAMALNPTHGKFGLASAIPTWSYFLSKGNENVLETLAKRGVWKLGGFSSEAEFKDYIRFAQKSGFFDLGDTHVMVNNYGPHTTFGSLSGGIDAVREQGRMFFYGAEVLNRLVAHRIAYGEAIEKFGAAKFKDDAFREFIAGRAENYSFNMSDQSKAWWQQGVLSIPTQFWAYNVRMIEALTGKNFTGEQKLRLLAAQVGMAGTGGVPIVAGMSEYLKEKYGIQPDINTLLGTVDRGIADRLIFEAFGADVLAGEKWGTGAWSTDLVRDLFGANQYGDKSLAENLGGATYSILSSTIGPVLPLINYYASHERGTESVDLSGDMWLQMAKQISTVNNTLKALAVYNYGIFQSTKGTVLANDIPSQDAFAVAIGFRPAELQESAVLASYFKDQSETIDEAAKVVRNWRQEAFSRPDLFEENAKKVNAFMNTLPVDIRSRVLNKANKSTDPSFYAGLLRRKQQEDLQASINGEQE